MVRNEEDVIEHTVRHMLNHDLDLVVVADNLSTDDTRDILYSIEATRLVIVDDNDPAYRQSDKMTALAEYWAEAGDWIVPFDADELWNTKDDQTLYDFLRSTTKTDVVAGFPLVHVPQPGDMPHSCPFFSMPYRLTAPEVWPKAALRWRSGTVIEQGNHWTKSSVPDLLDIRHFQYRSFKHLGEKVRAGAVALELTDLPADSGAHWRRFAAMSDSELEEWWIEYTNPTTPLKLDPPRCLA
jgi:glycosyltransferase involved in cell wall biosynthesis